MHPRLCEAVSAHSYADQLQAHACTLDRRLVDSAGNELQSGVVVELLDHLGNSVASAEEAGRVAALAREALTWRWRDSADARLRPVTPADVLIVAPYNAQVELIRQQLDCKGLAHFRVGTVDKFQGQEAPIVLVSLAASSHEDVPRGMEFLLSPNRTNVAVSGAQWRATIVHSGRLTDYLPNRPEQLHELGRFMRLVT